MQQKLITFAVPCYNSAAYMRHCIETLLSAGEQAEIILVDDGSVKDDTPAICDEYAAKYPTIVKAIHQENGGHGEGVNQGIRNATGLYYKVVDSDDWLAPDFTEKLVSAAEAHTADLVIAPFWMVYPENYVEHIRPWEKALQHVLQRNPPRTRAYGYLPAGVYTGQEYAKHLIQKPNTFYYGSPCNKLYRRDLLLKHSLHFRKELFAEDQLFNTEYLRYVRTAVSIPDIGY